MPSTRTERRTALFDVNALVALAWDSHVHHHVIRSWFARESRHGWATCPVTESGFVRVSSNPKVLPQPIAVRDAQRVLSALRAAGEHRFFVNDVSLTDHDLPALSGHRQVTDALLLAVARRNGARLLTFDRGVVALAGDGDVEVLGA